MSRMQPITARARRARARQMMARIKPDRMIAIRRAVAERGHRVIHRVVVIRKLTATVEAS